MELSYLLSVLRQYYDPAMRDLEALRASGGLTYAAYGTNGRCFVKLIRYPFLETAVSSAEVQLYLMENHFPVVALHLTRDGAPYVRLQEEQEYLLFLYDFVPGGEISSKDIEEAGALTGRLHELMGAYPGTLVPRDKPFFIDRYVEIMKRVAYPGEEAFRTLGATLWDRVKDLPRGYCHGDLYDGNIYKADDGRLLVVDFDTSCYAFPVYDVVLFCNRTHYFEFDPKGRQRTQRRLKRFLKGYLSHASLTKAAIDAFNDLLAVYHFQLQATIFQTFGDSPNMAEFFDKQYTWLTRWLAR
ncbi:MAG: phosphotransferase [Clostridiaceae bacterium]|nr:phosphotransferase [Clostridiaceae bacterium]